MPMYSHILVLRLMQGLFIGFKPGDTVMGMDLSMEDTLQYGGLYVNFSGINFRPVFMVEKNRFDRLQTKCVK